MARPLILLLFVAACSTTPPAPGPQPPTGAQTAKQAGEATRKAEAAGATGVLIASSADGAPAPSEPSEPSADVAPPVIRVSFSVDGAHVDGAPVVLATYFAEQAALQPKPHLVLVVAPTVEYGAVVEALDLAKSAGLTRVAIETEPAPAETTGQ